MKVLTYRSKHVAETDRLTVSSDWSTVVFRIILITFIHITETKRNITRKVLESRYKKHTVHRCSGNSGITNCTTATVTTTLQDFPQAVYAVYLKWNTNNFLEIIANYYFLNIIIFVKLWRLPLRAPLSKLQWNRVKYYRDNFCMNYVR